MDIDLSKLAEPFKAEDIEWRIGRCGVMTNGGNLWAVALAYVTSRAIQDRLDAVCGPGNWQSQYTEIEGGYLCGIGINVSGTWVWKWDGADKTDVEAIKGGLSGALKRAGVHWGIGRYLYDLKEGFVNEITKEKQKGDEWHYQPANASKQIPAFYWKSPQLPAWALPAAPPKAPSQPPRREGEGTKRPNGDKPATMGETGAYRNPKLSALEALLREKIGCKTQGQVRLVIQWAGGHDGEGVPLVKQFSDLWGNESLTGTIHQMLAEALEHGTAGREIMELAGCFSQQSVPA